MATQAEYARHRGVSRKTITLWKQRGLLVFDANSALNIKKSDAILANHGGKLTPLPVRTHTARTVPAGVRTVTHYCPQCGHRVSPA